MHDSIPYRIPPGQRQLFLDDGGIEQLDKLTKTLHQPDKKGAVIRSPNPSQTIQTRSAPIWDQQAECFKRPYPPPWASMRHRPKSNGRRAAWNLFGAEPCGCVSSSARPAYIRTGLRLDRSL